MWSLELTRTGMCFSFVPFAAALSKDSTLPNSPSAEKTEDKLCRRPKLSAYSVNVLWKNSGTDGKGNARATNSNSTVDVQKVQKVWVKRE